MTGELNSLAAPLPNILSMSEKLVPLGMMPNCRLQLTTETISEIFAAATTDQPGAPKANRKPPTDYTLKNVELCYSMVEFSGGVNDIVKSMGDKFFVKSTSFQNMSATISKGAAGTAELIYNMRLASIKSLFTNFQGTDATKNVNGKFDSVDITSGGGEFVYSIASTQYPTRPVSTLNNKSGLLMELRKAVGALHSESYTTSINQVEFSRNDVSTTTLTAPGKVYFGVNTEKLSSNGVLLSGVSTQSSPISLRVSLPNTAGTTANPGGGLSQSYSVACIAMFDCLIEVDPHNRQATVKQ